MPQIRTNRLYARMTDLELSAFAGSVITNLTDNTTYPTPPVALTDLELIKTNFDSAIIAAGDGGTLQTAQKDAARVALVTALNKEASYVDINCGGSLVALRSSGFQEVSTNRVRQVLDPPVIIAATNGPQSGQIQVRLKGDSHRRVLQGRLKPMGGEFGPVITFENTHEIIFKGLVAGTTYIMQLCGLGGSTGQSDWSEPVTKVAT